MNVKVYKNEEGWLFKVLDRLPGYGFKSGYKKPGEDKWHRVGELHYRDTQEKAQADLDRYAAKKGMSVVEV